MLSNISLNKCTIYTSSSTAVRRPFVINKPPANCWTCLKSNFDRQTWLALWHSLPTRQDAAATKRRDVELTHTYKAHIMTSFTRLPNSSHIVRASKGRTVGTRRKAFPGTCNNYHHHHHHVLCEAFMICMCVQLFWSDWAIRLHQSRWLPISLLLACRVEAKLAALAA